MPPQISRTDRWLTPWRLRWYPRLAAIGFLLGFAITVITADGPSTLTGRLGGDYPAFYAAGGIVASGEGAWLYDADRQKARQTSLLGADSLLYFPYPPFYALALAPLAQLDYRWSYLIHTLLMAGALLLATRLAGPVIPLVRRHFWLAAGLAASFYPMLKSVIGGQNTALTLLLLAATWHFQHKNRNYLSGVMLGLMLYKPQYALPLIGLHLVAGQWRVIVGVLIAASALYGIGVAMLGPGWVTTWIGHVAAFNRINLDVNGFLNISWLGFLANAFGVNALSISVGMGLASATAAFLAWVWWRRSLFDAPSRMALAIPGTLLLSPQTLYYDTGLILITLAVLIERSSRWRLAVMLIWIVGWSQLFAESLRFSPTFLALIATGLWAVVVLMPRANSRGQTAGI